MSGARIPPALAELLTVTPLHVDRAGHLRTAQALTASAGTRSLRLSPASRRRAEARVRLRQIVASSSTRSSTSARARLAALCNGGSRR